MSSLFIVNIRLGGHTLITLPFIRVIDDPRVKGSYLRYYYLFWIEESEPCLGSYMGHYHSALFWESMSLSYPEGGFSILADAFADPQGSFRLRKCIKGLVEILVNQVKYPKPLTIDFSLDQYKLSLKDISFIKRLYKETTFRSPDYRPTVRVSDKKNYYYKKYIESFSNSYLKSLVSKELGLQVDVASVEKVMSKRKYMFFLRRVYLFFRFTRRYRVLSHEQNLKLLNEGKGGFNSYFRPYCDFVLPKFVDTLCSSKDIALDREVDVWLDGQSIYYRREVDRKQRRYLVILEDYLPYLWLREGKAISVYNELSWGGYSSFFKGLEFRRLLRKLRRVRRCKSKDK